MTIEKQIDNKLKELEELEEKGEFDAQAHLEVGKLIFFKYIGNRDEEFFNRYYEVKRRAYQRRKNEVPK